MDTSSKTIPFENPFKTHRPSFPPDLFLPREEEGIFNINGGEINFYEACEILWNKSRMRGQIKAWLSAEEFENFKPAQITKIRKEIGNLDQTS